MKHLLILPLVLLCFMLNAQTGTIKIAKPTAKDTITPKKNRFNIIPIVGTNYTFKNNNKFGYQAGVKIGKSHYVARTSIGIIYCREIQYYALSEFNKALNIADKAYTKSQNESDYIKIPIEIGSYIITGRSKKRFYLTLGLTPEYLVNTKNEYDRLSDNDFRKFNLAGTSSLGVLLKKHYEIELKYSKDFLENLKDTKMYNSNGEAIGIQKSKTNLLSLSLAYIF